MTELSAEERDTLNQLVVRDAFGVFDGETLSNLHARGLVAFSLDGWEVTQLGLLSIDQRVYV
ncbi:hypothetical protein [Chenggangzhangella methanolivorans]|uniref:Uncharacterized protein n=1 Tax=Chenggangzhangella methanolivorans TaxID=1437009 RepID=A0A9E6RGE1_9HYPH|nr:hypothetical protein [Chenggangzhangella methanolivorans]QZO00951.1 hypothetical protein K6K41_04875 [Chenggangzhangella methanolivorans]